MINEDLICVEILLHLKLLHAGLMSRIFFELAALFADGPQLRLEALAAFNEDKIQDIRQLLSKKDQEKK